MDNQSFSFGSSSKPFTRCNFYLDVKNNPQLLTTISEDIISLGGTIESFLSKNIRYVVTNKPKIEWPSKPSEEVPSPNNHKINVSFSRGKMLLAKSTQVNQKTTIDALELARSLKIKIIQASEMMEFCKKYLITFRHKHNKNTSEFTVQKLTPPFIKILDNSNKYKANFKEFGEWPELSTDYMPELCPFFKKRKQSPSALVPVISQQSFKSTTLMNQQGVRFNDKCTVLTTPTITGTGATMAFLKSTTTTPMNGQVKKKMICEICHKDFDDFEKHLTDSQHNDFLTSNTNFTELLNVIHSLPNFIIESNSLEKNVAQSCENKMTDFALNDISNKDINNISSSSHLYRKLSSPSMQSIHSINNFGSVSKTFVALHDLVNEKNIDSRENIFR